MSDNAFRVFEDAHKLPQEVRAALAVSLIDSLDENVDPGAEKEWEAEIVRRLKEVRAGTVDMVPWPEVRQRILRTVDGSTR